MMIVHLLLRIVHVCCTAAWFGLLMTHPRRLRIGLAAGTDMARMTIEQIQREGKMAFYFSLLTLFSGLGLLVLDGPANVPHSTNSGAAVALLGIVLLIAMYNPSLKKIQSAVAAASSPADLKALTGPVAAASGIIQTTWLIALVMMLWRA